jgi:hypothetical protein
MSRILQLLTISLLFFSCEELVQPDLVAAPPVLVVDAWITDFVGNSFVKLSWSGPFDQEGNNNTEDSATVLLNDNFGNTTVFKTQHEGIYLPGDTLFKGVIGRLYTLKINVNETEYSASGVFPSGPKPDSLSLRLREKDEFFDAGYYVTINFTDPALYNNYYKWEIYRGAYHTNKLDVLIANDATFDGKFIRQEFLYPFQSGDTLVVEQYSITKNAYRYYEGIRLITLQGNFSQQTVPENPPSNIQGGGLGFFTMATLSRLSVIVP